MECCCAVDIPVLQYSIPPAVSCARRENFVDLETALGESLLKRIIEQRIENHPVFFHRIGPGIGTEQRAFLFLLGAEPRQRRAAMIGPVFIGLLLGIFESAHELCSHVGCRAGALHP